MEKEFVPYYESYRLSYLGFNFECFGEYFTDGELTLTTGKETYLKSIKLNKTISCSAPLWQQAFEWFRENYNLNAEISNGGVPNMYSVFVREYIYEGSKIKLFTYDDALLASLKKLIDIVESNSYDNT